MLASTPYLIAHRRYEPALVADVEDTLTLRKPDCQQLSLGNLQVFDALRLEDCQLHGVFALVEIVVVDQSHPEVRGLP